MQCMHDAAVNAHLRRCENSHILHATCEQPGSRCWHEIRLQIAVYLDGAHRLVVLTHNNKGRQPLVRHWLLAITCLHPRWTVSPASQSCLLSRLLVKAKL